MVRQRDPGTGTSGHAGPAVLQAGRRSFISSVFAGAVASAMAGCERVQPPESIVPRTREDPKSVQGRALDFATALTRHGSATGVLVRCHEGRPMKVEGNLAHPSSLGATDRFAQAEVLSLYDPDRSRESRKQGAAVSTESVLHELRDSVESLEADEGRGLHFLTPPIASPTLRRQLRDMMNAYPAASWHVHDPLITGNAARGALIAFDKEVVVEYRLDDVRVVAAFDCDLFSVPAGGIRYARDFAERRRVRTGQVDPTRYGRLWVAEPIPTVTGARADERFAVRPSRIAALVVSLAAEIGIVPRRFEIDAKEARWIEGLATDLLAAGDEGLVVVGDSQPAALHALAHLINQKLGSFGRGVRALRPESPPGQPKSLADLADALEADRVDTLVVLGVNVAYNAPADLRMAELVGHARRSLHLGLYYDETARACYWHIPQAHAFESWSDARGHDGTASVVQPLIAPLFGGKSMHEVLASCLGDDTDARQQVRNTWWARLDPADPETAWRRALRDGILTDTAFEEEEVRLNREATLRAVRDLDVSPNESEGGALEVVFTADPTVDDGDFANNAWLQELPKPITKLTWDNAVFIAPRSAEALGVQNEQVVKITLEGRTVDAPVWIHPGQADRCVVVVLGYGRGSAAGRVAEGRGYDAYRIRPGGALSFATGATLRPTSKRRTLATAQPYQRTAGREPVRRYPVGRLPGEAEPEHHPSLYPPRVGGGHQWGMTIDLNACIGCGVCTIACQVENNVPVVGKEGILAHREMHWIRVDTYYEGDAETSAFLHQPCPCMHCEHAPCEVVCPVAATQHSSDGLNEMIYNRCVGTRYCSNNCPYKVRRFNFRLYGNRESSLIALARNPEVTVRARGVMEKCTYCVQRIRSAGIRASRDDHALSDGDVVMACQQACPTQAIVFGDLSDDKSQVSSVRHAPHHYRLLAELNTRPRTSYLADLHAPYGKGT